MLLDLRSRIEVDIQAQRAPPVSRNHLMRWAVDPFLRAINLTISSSNTDVPAVIVVDTQGTAIFRMQRQPWRW